ncbi:NUDIX hydrolase [Ornithinibacillus halophilus]|uniref:ADP-ribose pyrophosphatase YjhB, NUDIX family n=1 Tax=Ornithinibacillus halophilus TaxID=930117 RepID=A0A1M5LGJ7_9BACI|nr:NUDIX domain-containing protein [Ornithinibacillus halophilus]SHG64167.1 ADP-ribose pyrophosphatase YjhB, NUDIX family [Ornithinibacillus halophilus]
MLFNKQFTYGDMPKNYTTINTRVAVRAVILYKNKILLIQSNKGDFKFPGGGVEENESHTQALVREIAEETGYIHCEVKNKIGFVLEQQADKFTDDTIYQQHSHYYLCELVDDKRIEQNLDEYEIEQEFLPKWLTIDEAIKENEKASLKDDRNGWITRETYVLNELKIQSTRTLR